MKDFGIIITHGFGGDVTEIEPLSNKLIEEGYNVLTPSLRGHTGKRKELKNVSYSDWLEDVEEAYLNMKNHYKDILLIGFSMGSLLSLQVAAKYPICGVITINAPIYIGSTKSFIKHTWNDIRRFKFNFLKYKLNSSLKYTVNAVIEFKKLVSDTKTVLEDVTCGVLLNQSYDDETVHYKSVNYLYEHIGSSYKQIKMYKDSHHLMLHSDIANEVVDDIIRYIKQKEFLR